MGVNDPIRIEFNEKRQKYYLAQGRETFYVRCLDAEDQQHWKVNCWACDHLDEWIMFDTFQEAASYAVIELGAKSVRVK